MTSPTDVVARIERSWAEDHAAFVRSLVHLDPTWGGETFPLAGGQVALSGRGLYVNVAQACGISPDLSMDDVDRLEARCAAVRVVPAIELTVASSAETRALVARRGYRLTRETTALAFDLADRASGSDVRGFSMAPVEANEDLLRWQRAAAVGWGHDTPSRRRASDAFAAAVFATTGQTLFLGLDADGAVVGCASVQMRGDLATLGGMSTLPDHRRRGVQSALVQLRLDVAQNSGATLATSTTEPGSASERNLLRLGFRRSHVKQTFELR